MHGPHDKEGRCLKLTKVVIALFIIIIIVIVLASPVGLIKKVKVRTEISGMEGIKSYEIDKIDFTYLAWIGHEANKLSIVGDYTLSAEICDPPSDCDSDSIKFNWGGETVRYSLYVPTFIGERELNIELKQGSTVIDSVTATVMVE